MTNSTHADVDNAAYMKSTLLLTEREAADRLQVSMRTMYDLRKAGRIRFVSIGQKGYRYTVQALLDFIEQNQKAENPKG